MEHIFALEYELKQKHWCIMYMYTSMYSFGNNAIDEINRTIGLIMFFKKN